MAKLSEIVRQASYDDGRLAVEASPAWSQGRTLYGGMTAALCFEAAKHVAPDMTLRSAQLLFAGPASGTLTMQPKVFRKGRSSAAVAVNCAGEDGPAALAGFAFGADRDSHVELAPRPRSGLPAPPEQCPPFIGPTGGFHDNFDLRLAEGSALLSGGPQAFTVWVRFREPQNVDATTALLALGDSLPPAAMASFPEMAPISTMTWSIDLIDQPANVDGWHLLRSTSEQTQNGYSTQTMDLWDASGRHLAAGRQLIAIFI